MRNKILIKILIIFIIIDTILLLILLYLSIKKNCLHLPKKYCAKGKVITLEGFKGETFKAVAYSLPEGTPLFAPVTADLHISPTQTFILGLDGKEIKTTGLRLIKTNKEGRIEYIVSFVFYIEKPEKVTRKVRQGEKIGELKKVSILDGYNLLVSVFSFNKDKKMFVENERLLKKLILGEKYEK